MANSNTAENLLHDVTVELVAKAKEAKLAADSSGSDFDKGRQLALYEVVSLLIQQAVAFGLPLERIGAGGFDADRELL